MSDDREYREGGPPNLASTRSGPAAPAGPGPAARHHETRSRHQPERIGPYKILGLLGEGGMGTVYLAEQTSPVHRRVALKIIKLGMDTRDTLARFEAEREALAVMNHPGVAKVYDAGVSDEGRPYFVMEHVPGIPITEYCDRHRLSTRERLQLFVQVCHAVQHAHQKGIIHRDIKPGNVLVAVQDGGAVPKVIDFGVAKATQQRLTERTLFTEQGQLIGTPGYMSPEQAEMSGLDVDTRTDVYSLGVLLYEILVGARPFDDEALRRAGFAEIQRIIREVDPPRPSTRLSSLGNGSAQVAQKRRTELRSLSRLLRGDLDWVVMKCLEKDRNRRYETANALGMEIQRYLGNEPVFAGPPRASYRLRKFVRRNRGAVAAGVLVTLVLVLATGVSVAFALREAEQRRVAEAERDRAHVAEETATAVKEFLIHDMLRAANPAIAQGEDLGVLELLDAASARVGTAFGSQPLVQAEVRATIGRAFLFMSRMEDARDHFESAVRISAEEFGFDDPRTLRLRDQLGYATLQVAILRSTGREPPPRDLLELAESTLRETLSKQREQLGPSHPDCLTTATDLARTLYHQKRYEEAAALSEELLRRCVAVHGPDGDATNRVRGVLVDVLHKSGNDTRALELCFELNESRARTLGPHHPNTLLGRGKLARMLLAADRCSEAEEVLRELIPLHLRVFKESADLAVWKTLMANVMQCLGRTEEEIRARQEAYALTSKALGGQHPRAVYAGGAWVGALFREKRYDEAVAVTPELCAASVRAHGRVHEETLRVCDLDAFGHLRVEDHAAARDRYYAILGPHEELFGADDERTVRVIKNLSYAVAMSDGFDAADAFLAEWTEKCTGEAGAEVRAQREQLRRLQAAGTDGP